MSIAPGPARSRGWRNRVVLARRLWAASSLSLVLALLVLLSLLSALRPSVAEVDRVDDERFLAAASRACSDARPDLERAAEDPDAVAAALERLVVDLRSLPVTEDDRAAVDAWLSEWDTWTATGHDYADARAAGDEEAAAAANDRGLAARSAVNRFAYANGLASCVV